MASSKENSQTSQKGEKTSSLAVPARERLLLAGNHLFAEFGYDGTSTRAIANEAQCNIGQISFYFDGKPGLYEAVMQGVYQHLLSIMNPVTEDLTRQLGEETGAEDMGRSLHLHVRTILQALLVKGYSRTRYMLLLRSSMEKNNEHLYKEIFGPLLNALSATAQRMSPGLSAFKADMAAFLLVNSTLSVLRDFPPYLAMGKYAEDLDAATETLADMLYGGFISGIGRNSQAAQTADNTARI